MWKWKSNGSDGVARGKSSGSPKPKSSMLPLEKTANRLQSLHEKNRLRRRRDELHLPGISRAARQHHIAKRNVDERRTWLSPHVAPDHQRTKARIHSGRIRETGIVSQYVVCCVQGQSETDAGRS